MKHYDLIVIGAGAAGLMCAISAGKRGKSVLVVEHARKVGRKILMSGGGRCNFTNMYTEPENFLSRNPHFCKSALSQYSQWDFIDLVNHHQIPYHEKTLGQLFCDNSSKDVVQILVKECSDNGVSIATQCQVSSVEQIPTGFKLLINDQRYEAGAVSVATGGLSIPSMGPHGFGYQLAEQFGLDVIPTSAALVPFVMGERWMKKSRELAGNSLDVVAEVSNTSFREAMLFTHKGLSGPAILQISSYWQPGSAVHINLIPDVDATSWLIEQKSNAPKTQLKTVLSSKFSKRMASYFIDSFDNRIDSQKSMADFTNQELAAVGQSLSEYTVYPETTEGYKTAEVTLGGLDTNALSSKTMMVKDIPGLIFIGEVVDVTGHLGGFNFQWAWSSGWAAGQHL
ncbi:NAD(P)/FAD-dependent oxidoreductase [Pleionea sediminis]|uniref:NAD(P)/FAD-dependent oxidoreductase n=1 Tax=Pleionea sediminis TaxID=2569479 RepID=UPI001184BE27|nr:NAD(P)/FAD-dependent oxidoreductase [Pleionea sediminis]